MEFVKRDKRKSDFGLIISQESLNGTFCNNRSSLSNNNQNEFTLQIFEIL